MPIDTEDTESYKSRASAPTRFINQNLPYVVAVLLAIIILYIGFILFCKPVRECLFRILCCRSEALDEESGGTSHNADILPNETFQVDRSRSKSRSNSDGHHANVGRPRTPSYQLPHIDTQPTVPQKQQLVTTAKTAKYIGNLLALGRRPPPPMSTNYSTQTVAPPAAKQIARTARIIGNILTVDRKKARR